MKRLLILSGLFLTLLISGCGSGQVKGTGTVKYDTGEPVPFGMVIFSTDTNQYTGEIKNGVFALGGIRPKNGLPPGNYKVTIQGTDENDKSIVAAKYNAVSTSDLSYEVKTGQKNYFEIIVQKP